MDNHFHHNIDTIIFTTVSVVVAIHVVRMLAAKLAEQDGAIGQLGGSLGAVFSFPAPVGK